jgi:uncharacterized protein YqeY
MTLEMLEKEMTKARRNRDTVRITAISGLVNAVKVAAINERCKDNITEEFVNNILIKEQKTVQEMIDTCPADRTDLMTDYKNRMAIVKEFAPQLLTDTTEIKNQIMDAVNGEIEFTKNNKGKIMKIIAPIFKGKADMKIVNQVIGEILA